MKQKAAFLFFTCLFLFNHLLLINAALTEQKEQKLTTSAGAVFLPVGKSSGDLLLHQYITKGDLFNVELAIELIPKAFFVTDTFHNTPLHLAVKNYNFDTNRYKIIDLVLKIYENHQDPKESLRIFYYKDKDSKTAAGIAFKNKFDDIYKKIKKAITVLEEKITRTNLKAGAS
jgi:ankyrin repeat protein